MRRTNEDDWPIRRYPPCSSRLNAPKEDVDNQSPKEQRNVECDVGRHEILLDEDSCYSSGNKSRSVLVYWKGQRGEERCQVVNGSAEMRIVLCCGPARVDWDGRPAKGRGRGGNGSSSGSSLRARDGDWRRR